MSLSGSANMQPVGDDFSVYHVPTLIFYYLPTLK